MHRRVYVTPLQTTPLRAAIGILVNIVLLADLFTVAHNALAVVLGVAMLITVMFQAERQGWGPFTRSAAGIAAGVITFLILNH